MNSLVPILAHYGGGPAFTNFDIAMMLLLGASWLASLGLAIVNPVLIANLYASTKFRVANFAIWAASVTPGVLLFWYLHDKPLYNEKQLGIAPDIFGVYFLAFPIVTISHFGFLRWTQGRLRRYFKRGKTQ